MLERGRYGVEWTKRPEDREASVFGRIVVIVVLLALISLAWTVSRRVYLRIKEKPAETETAVEQPNPTPPTAAPAEPTPAEPAYQPPTAAGTKRSPKVRNLLMRLEVAEQRRDVEMAVSTIEQIRAMPGSPAADLDDALARRLGVLNLRRLFTLKSAQWVTTVTVKSGQSASRIASEHGSTLASLAKLNGGNVDAIRVGQELSVLNHPRFALVVRRRTRTADLQLNGKFFKRYDLKSATGGDGAYEVTIPIRAFWKTVGVEMKPSDRAELELLMPKGASVIVSEM